MTGFWFGLAIGICGGGALGWLCKDWIMVKYKGTAKFVGDLEDQVRSLKARLR